MTNGADRKPGQFADERFRARRAAWRRRVGPYVTLGAASVLVISIAIAAITGSDVRFYLGLGIGAALSFVSLLDSPPHHIERWRTGAEGERRTARALRSLTSEGWIVLHDLPVRFGNIDHVLVGPAGVFLLETKNLSGRVSVTDDTLQVRWVEDPEDGYSNQSIGRRARAAAAQLSADLAVRTGRRPWVQSVVVLWAQFDQEVVEADRVIWASGEHLAHALRGREPRRLDADAIERVVVGVRAVAAAQTSRGDP